MMDAKESSDLYSKGLAAAALIQKKSVKAATVNVRSKAVTELCSWLHTIQAADSKTIQNASPEDLLVFFMQHWLPNHAGSLTANDEHIAAPGSLSAVKSHLATELELLGRCGEWDPISLKGNPMHSNQIRNMLKGYSNHATELGYQKKGAVPLSEAEMTQLLSSMAQRYDGSADHEQLLLLRDGLLFSMLWQTCFRGSNAGAVRLSNFTLPAGGSALPYLYPSVQLASGAQLHILPDTTNLCKHLAKHLRQGLPSGIVFERAGHVHWPKCTQHKKRQDDSQAAATA